MIVRRCGISVLLVCVALLLCGVHSHAASSRSRMEAQALQRNLLRQQVQINMEVQAQVEAELDASLSVEAETGAVTSADEPFLYYDGANANSYLRAPYLPQQRSGPIYGREGPQSGSAKEWLEKAAMPAWPALPFGPRMQHAPYVAPFDHFREVHDEFSWSKDRKPPQFAWAPPIFVEQSSEAHVVSEGESETEVEGDHDHALVEVEQTPSANTGEEYTVKPLVMKNGKAVNAPKSDKKKQSKGKTQSKKQSKKQPKKQKKVTKGRRRYERRKAQVAARKKKKQDKKKSKKKKQESGKKVKQSQEQEVEMVDAVLVEASSSSRIIPSGGRIPLPYTPPAFWASRGHHPSFHNWANPYFALTHPGPYGSFPVVDPALHHPLHSIHAFTPATAYGNYNHPLHAPVPVAHYPHQRPLIVAPHPHPYAYHHGMLPPFAHEVMPYSRLINTAPSSVYVGQNEQSDFPKVFLEAGQQQTAGAVLANECENCSFQ